jgi:archaemetzincin
MRAQHGGGDIRGKVLYNIATMPRIVTAISLMALTFFAPIVSAKTVDEHVFLIPAGEVDGKILEAIKDDLPDHLPMDTKVEIMEREKLPQAAYDASRSQYNAEAVLDGLAPNITLVTGNESALIVTDADLYTNNFDFVYGLSDKPRATSILSTARLKDEFYGLKPDKALFLKRLMKETLHELGLAWGLPHCPDQSCAMYFARSLKEIDSKKSKFCHDCRNRLHHRYYSPLIKGVDLLSL